MTFCATSSAGPLGPEGRPQTIEQLLTFVETGSAFRVFEAIEQTKRELSSQESALFSFRYPTIEIDEAIARSTFEHSSARATNRSCRARRDAAARRPRPRRSTSCAAPAGTARLTRQWNALWHGASAPRS